MQRNPAALSEKEFDVLIIGGGAFGAAAARDAALRGLNTALIERADFGAGASAECFKMVHGGIRYLQHADLPRLRASCRERAALLRIAPHLVNPLPIAIPTYGHGRRGRAFLGAGARAYDVLTLGRNCGIADPDRRIRRTQVLSRSEVLEHFPQLEAPDLSGAVVFEDGQMYNPARLVLAFVKGAASAGAVVCNYICAQSLLWEGDAIRGVRAHDVESGDVFDVRARLTLNAAGPWADYLLQDEARFGRFKRPPYSRDAYFIVDRQPSSPYGVAVQGLSRDKDAVLGRATRHLFAAPWRDKTLIGVWHRHFTERPDAAHVEREEIARWMDELNTVYPSFALSPEEVTFAHCGLVPFGETATETELSFGKESRIIDHRTAHGVAGLVTLVGIRFTTARADAARALDVLLKQFHLRTKPAPTHRLPLPGGDIDDFRTFEIRVQCAESEINSRALIALLRNHGAEYWRVLDAGKAERDALVPGTTTLRAELHYTVESEMAIHLEDVVMRRTDLAAGSHPGADVLEFCGNLMAPRLRWSRERLSAEIAAAERALTRHLAKERAPEERKARRTGSSSESGAPVRVVASASPSYQEQAHA